VVTLRTVCLQEAKELAREIAATADLWLREGIYPDEIPYVRLQLRQLEDFFESAFEPDADMPLTADAVLSAAERGAILDGADGC
jgi:hypothetical protein